LDGAELQLESAESSSLTYLTLPTFTKTICLQPPQVP